MLLSELYSTRRLIERESKGKRDGRYPRYLSKTELKQKKIVSTAGIEPAPQLRRQAAFAILLGAKKCKQ